MKQSNKSSVYSTEYWSKIITQLKESETAFSIDPDQTIEIYN